MDNGGIISVPTRSDADSLRNRASLDFNAKLTELLGLGIGYVNTWYNYDQDGVGGRGALLDRMEHLLHLDLRMQITPPLVGLLGYQFGYNDYRGKEAAFFDFFGSPVTSNIRDSYSHYFYAGVDHTFTTQLSGSARVGAQYTDYKNTSETEWSPYVDVNFTYTYLPGSYVQLGAKHMRNATDIISQDSNGSPTLDQESSALYGSVTHQITRDFTATLLGQYQMSTFNGGQFNDDEDNLWLIGLNFDYRINMHWAIEMGYNFDTLESDIPNRSFARNRVYVGVRASY